MFEEVDVIVMFFIEVICFVGVEDEGVGIEFIVGSFDLVKSLFECIGV